MKTVITLAVALVLGLGTIGCTNKTETGKKVETTTTTEGGKTTETQETKTTTETPKDKDKEEKK